jgi:hypothetical protein
MRKLLGLAGVSLLVAVMAAPSALACGNKKKNCKNCDQKQMKSDKDSKSSKGSSGKDKKTDT